MQLKPSAASSFPTIGKAAPGNSYGPQPGPRAHSVNRRLCKRTIWDGALGVVAPHRVVPCASGATTRDAQIVRSLRVSARKGAGRVALLARSPATRRVARLASALSGLGVPAEMHQVPIYGMSSSAQTYLFLMRSITSSAAAFDL